MNRVFVAPSLALLLLLTSCGSSPTSIVDPQPLALQLSDMPPGYAQDQAAYGGIIQAGNKQVGLGSGHGLVAGYHTQFKLSGLVGLLQVEDAVASYRTADDAHRAFNAAAAAVRTRNFQPLSMTPYGDEAKAFSYQGKQGGMSLEADVIMLRRGNCIAAVFGGGIAGSFAATQLFKLAKNIDHRISNAPVRAFTPVPASVLAAANATSTATPAPPPPTAPPTPASAVNGSYADPSTGVTAAVAQTIVDTKGSQYDRPKAGFLRQLVFVTLRNDGTTSVAFNPYDFQAVDQLGQTYDQGASVGDQRVALHSGDMPAGENRAGWIAFEIPTSTSTLTISWSDGSTLSPPVELKVLTYGPHNIKGTAPLQTLAVQLSDLRVGYGVQSEGTGYRTLQTASGSPGMSLQQLRVHGWTGMYVISYTRTCSTCAPSDRTITIDNEVHQYRSESGAHWDYVQELGQAAGEYKFRREVGASMGDEGIAYYSIGQSGARHSILFHRGRYVVYLSASTAAPYNSASNLAQAVDARIQRTG